MIQIVYGILIQTCISVIFYFNQLLDTTYFYYHILLCAYGLLALEEILTQNGPPKKINKIIFINFGGRKEKTHFFVCIFDMSPHVFTQILIGRAHWMWN